MIFLTVGSKEPFDRLVRAVDEWCADRQRDDVFGQIAEPGRDGYTPRNYEWTSFIKPGEVQKYFEDADFIVSHAGMGTIISALTLGKPILIVPRREAFKETRNDHQVGTAERFRIRPGVRVAKTEAEVGRELDSLVARRKEAGAGDIAPFADKNLIDAIRSQIIEK